MTDNSKKQTNLPPSVKKGSFGLANYSDGGSSQSKKPPSSDSSSSNKPSSTPPKSDAKKDE